MSRTIVIVSNEPPPEGLERHETGAFTVYWYVCLDVEDKDDYQDILDLCRRKRAAGILAGAASLLPLVSRIADALGLIGPAAQLAQLMNDRALLLEKLRTSGVPTIPFRVALTEEEAVTAARSLGEPVVVQAVEGTEGARSRYVQFLPEVGLGYRQVTRDTNSKRALISHPQSAVRHSAFYYAFKNEVKMAALFDVEVDPRFMYPILVSTPARVDLPVASAMADLGGRVVQAIRFSTGVLRIDVLETSIGLQVAGADMCPLSGWLPYDIAGLAEITELYSGAMQLSAGDEPPPVQPPAQSAAIAWLQSPSGEVDAVDGKEEAEAVEGVQSLFVRVEPEDIIRHVVDQSGRDGLGFVVACGPDTATAEERAAKAAAAVRIRTHIAYEDSGDESD